MAYFAIFAIGFIIGLIVQDLIEAFQHPTEGEM